LTTAHLLHQFRLAIEDALASKAETRAAMRARAAKQRFPVAQWVEDLAILQSTAIRLHEKVSERSSRVKLSGIPDNPNSLTKGNPEAAQNTFTTEIELETFQNEHGRIL